MLSHFRRISALPSWAHGALAATACAGAIGSFSSMSDKLGALEIPPDYKVIQLAFSGRQVKAYYSDLREAGTLDLYRETQLLDFSLILAIACVGVFVCTLFAREGWNGGLGRRLALAAGLLTVAGAISDVFENMLSFVMLADPEAFPDWLAISYSAFASLKFVCLAMAVASFVVSLACAAFAHATGGVEQR